MSVNDIRILKIGKTASLNDDNLAMANEPNSNTPCSVVLPAAHIPGADIRLKFEVITSVSGLRAVVIDPRRVSRQHGS